MSTNPRMYRKNHPFASKYSQKNAPKQPTAKQLREKFGSGFITPLSAPAPAPRVSIRQQVNRTIKNKAATRIQRKWRASRPVHPPCWNRFIHYGQCGQSCPCCRKRAGEILGACPVC